MISRFLMPAVGVCLLTLFVSTAVQAAPPASQDSLGKSEILSKFNELAAGQKEILKQLEEIKKELYIVKIRASQK